MNYLKNPMGDDNLQLAYDFAKRKHGDTGAIRKSSGDPYFVHPQMVADLALAYGGTDAEVEAAYLHDTLEDTETTAEELEAVFGPEVAQIVEEVTNYAPDVEYYGKEEYINHELLELSDSALFVKLCDMLANTLDYPKPGQAERMERNIQFLINNSDVLPDKCRRLLKSFPSMGEYDLDVDEFEDEYLDDVEGYQTIVASKNKPLKGKLDEKTLDWFLSAGTSHLTQKHYDIRMKENYYYTLRKILSVQDKSLRFYFDVSPTFSKGSRSSRVGHLKPTKVYNVQIQFDKAFKYLPEFIKDDVKKENGEEIRLRDLYLLDRPSVEKFWQKVQDKCDMRFYSDDPSFYWQGCWEDLSNQRAAIKPFKGKHGDGTWRARHAASGGLVNPKIRITKHITQIIWDLDDYRKKIIDYFMKGELGYTKGVGEK